MEDSLVLRLVSWAQEISVMKFYANENDRNWLIAHSCTRHVVPRWQRNHLGFVRVGLADPCLIQHWVADYRYPGFSFNGINVQIAFEYFGWVQLLEFWRKFVSCPQA